MLHLISFIRHNTCYTYSVSHYTFENCVVQDCCLVLPLAAYSYLDGVKKMALVIHKGANVTAVDKINMFIMMLN